MSANPVSSHSRPIVVAGASGLIGSRLLPALREAGYPVQCLVRRVPRAGSGEIGWDPTQGYIDCDALAGVHAVINLAGQNIAAHRWTRAFKQTLADSRIRGTQLLSETLARMTPRPAVLINASAVGYYGSQGERLCDEESNPGTDFLADVCGRWESATAPARQAGIRVVRLRIGFVLAGEGGGLAQMLPPFKLGLGGVVGSGEQYVSWIALSDLVRVFLHALAEKQLSGSVNAVSPSPVTNREFTTTLAKLLHRPAFMKLPASMIRLRFGEMADAVLLSSLRASSAKLVGSGFTFQFPDLTSALRYELKLT